MPFKLVIVIHNVRSCHNVGSMLRSADVFGVYKVYLTGYTPYPYSSGDKRLPHLAQKADRQIHKTALGAEKTVNWTHQKNISTVLDKLRTEKYTVAAVEQSKNSIKLADYRPSAEKIALIVGSEVGGIEQAVLEEADAILEIPQSGSKESLNVSVAAAIAMYQLKSG
jgi:23S rRNA (guanosine2251-2'-O)-methyltransferase